MEAKQVQFLPFHAINEFMRDDFRLAVLRSVLMNFGSLAASLQDSINRITRKVVIVPGFRNSEKAPASVKLLPLVSAFQKNPELVALILSAWAEIHDELRSQVFHVLKARGWLIFPDEINTSAGFNFPTSEQDWGILPPKADRTRFPGFLIFWPDGQDYEVIYQTFNEMYPHADASIDKVSLMAIWLTLRLPYKISKNDPEAES